MKRALLFLILIALANSGCTEKEPTAIKSADDLKNQSISSAENLLSYSTESSVSQTLKLHIGNNESAKRVTTITDRAETKSTVNLAGFMAHAVGSTVSSAQTDDLPVNSRNTSAEVYQIGNSTYVKDESGNWTHLVDPRPASELWGKNINNQVLALARSFNLSEFEEQGTEEVRGVEALKLRILPKSEDYTNLYDAAFSIAAKVSQYPIYLPAINRSELNESMRMDKSIWIAKDSGIPLKYESVTSFSMSPEIVGAFDSSTGQMKRLNQSIRLGVIDVSIETSDVYYDLDGPTSISLPEEARLSPGILPSETGALTETEVASRA